VAVTALAAVTGVIVALILASNQPAVRTVTVHRVAILTTTVREKPKVIFKTVRVRAPSTNTVAQRSPLPSTPSGSPSALTACDQNISVNSQTSCALADAVFSRYAQGVHTSGARTTVVSASSASTGQSVQDTCNYNSADQVVLCSNGSDLIRFPYWAAQVYKAP
jgi:hypothetical protein